MTEAMAEGTDMVMTQGATQSNHARQTAATARHERRAHSGVIRSGNPI